MNHTRLLHFSPEWNNKDTEKRSCEMCIITSPFTTNTLLFPPLNPANEQRSSSSLFPGAVCPALLHFLQPLLAPPCVYSVQTVCLFALGLSASFLYIFSTGARRTIKIWPRSQAACDRSSVPWFDCDGTVMTKLGPISAAWLAARRCSKPQRRFAQIKRWEAAFWWTSKYFCEICFKQWQQMAPRTLDTAIQDICFTLLCLFCVKKHNSTGGYKPHHLTHSNWKTTQHSSVVTEKW